MVGLGMDHSIGEVQEMDHSTEEKVLQEMVHSIEGVLQEMDHSMEGVHQEMDQ